MNSLVSLESEVLYLNQADQVVHAAPLPPLSVFPLEVPTDIRIFAHPNASLREQISVHPNVIPHEQIDVLCRVMAVN